MATKAALETRIAQLEREEKNSLAVIDALSDASRLTGLRVVCDATAPGYSVLVIGRGLKHEDGAKIGAIFLNTLRIAEGLMVISAEAVTQTGDETKAGE